MMDIERWLPLFFSIKSFLINFYESLLSPSPFYQMKFIVTGCWMYLLVWMFSSTIILIFAIYNDKYVFNLLKVLFRHVESFDLKFIENKDFKNIIKNSAATYIL